MPQNNRIITMLKQLRFFHNFILLLLGGSLLVACFDDSDVIDFSTRNDLYVSNVTFGTMPRTMHTVTKAGKDSTYTSSFSAASAYPMTIDQINNRIFNVDSLPKGCHYNKILFTNFAVNGGSFGLRLLNSEKDTVYATADTLDFTFTDDKGRHVREFTLYGEDGTSKRTYSVEVRIHEQKEDSLTWRQQPITDWDESRFTLCNTTDTYLLDRTAEEGQEYAFRLKDGMMEISADGGSTYEADSIVKEEVPFLPTSNLAWISSETRIDKDIVEVLLYGTRTANDKQFGTLWRRNIDLKGDLKMGWELLPTTSENANPVPTLRDAALYQYDKGYLLVGVDSNDSILVKYSSDYGRTWKKHDVLVLPKEVAQKKVNSLKSVVDEDSNLWLLINDEELWYGRVHRLGWNDIQKVFNKAPKR